MTVIQGDSLREKNIFEFQDLSNNVPGMSFRSDFGGSNAPSIVIRGVGFDDFRASGNPSAALHLDGVYLGSNAFLTGQMFDVERIEVLKGPQGTLYGRNTTAGVVNIITKGPEDRWEGYLDSQFGRFETLRFEGGIGGPVTDDLGIRLAGMVENSDGFLNSLGTGDFAGFSPAPGVIPPIDAFPAEEDFGDTDIWAIKATAVYEPSDRTRLTLRGNFTKDQSELFADIAGFAFGFTEPDTDPFTVFTNIDTAVDSEIYGVSLELNQRIVEGLDLTLLAALESVDRIAPFNEGAPIRGSDTILQDDLDQRTVELRLNGTSYDRLDWTAGFFLLDDDGNFDNEIIALDGILTNLIQDNRQERFSWAFFGQATWQFTSRLSLTGGLRFTKEEATLVGQTFDPNPFGISLVPFIFDFPVVFDNRFEDSNVSGKASLAYKFNDNANGYVSFSRGFKSGGFDGSGLFTEEEALPFDSETLLAYEAGSKVSWPDAGLSFDIAAFYYDFSDLQATTSVRFTPGGTPTNVRTNVADATSYGGELQLAWTPLKDLDFSLGLALLDTKIKNFVSDDPAQAARREGNELPDSPHVTLNFSGRLERKLIADWRYSLLVAGRYTDEAFKELDNFQAIDSFFDGTARASIISPGGHFELAGWVENFTNDVYFTAFLVDEAGNGLRIPAPRITYGITLSTKF